MNDLLGGRRLRQNATLLCNRPRTKNPQPLLHRCVINRDMAYYTIFYALFILSYLFFRAQRYNKYLSFLLSPHNKNKAILHTFYPKSIPVSEFRVNKSKTVNNSRRLNNMRNDSNHLAASGRAFHEYAGPVSPIGTHITDAG